MEEVLAAHPAVAECAVIGIEDADKGQVPLGLLLLKDGSNVEPAELEKELVQMVRQQVGAFANFKRAVPVKRLPKTRSGKILRQVVRRMVDGKAYVTPSTIDDPAVIPEIGDTLREHGIMRDRTAS
jgi:propionyl-CoA synthetase